jgi:putative spermidine/putrescine transport system ATP-binding protein
MAPMNGEIAIVGATKRFGQTLAVDNISLIIPHGAYCCLLGPSGCGKTTILRMIAGHETPTSGDIRIGGESVVGLSPARRGTAMMFQSYALFPHLTVRENVAFSLKMRRVNKARRQEEADKLLAKVGLEAFADRPPAQLSGGQQQRVALARALVTNPRVLLLDEPLSALDEYLRLRMRGELRRVQKELGITFIHVTHTQLEAIAVADLVVVMEQGRIEQAGTPREIYTTPRNAYVARFIGGQNVLSGIVEEVVDGNARAADASGARLVIPLAGRKITPGSPLFASIRRDRIELARVTAGATSARAENVATGVVHAIEYQGTYVKITVDLPASGEFVAYLTDAAFFRDPLEIGDRVTARWSLRDLHILDDRDDKAARQSLA